MHSETLRDGQAEKGREKPDTLQTLLVRISNSSDPVGMGPRRASVRDFTNQIKARKCKPLQDGSFELRGDGRM